MGKRTFDMSTIDEARFLDIDGYEKVSYEPSHTTRWSIYYEFIFRFEDRLWMVIWGEGATEAQESTMWEDTVEATEVEATEVTTTQYVPVENAADEGQG